MSKASTHFDQSLSNEQNCDILVKLCAFILFKKKKHHKSFCVFILKKKKHLVDTLMLVISQASKIIHFHSLSADVYF